MSNIANLQHREMLEATLELYGETPKAYFVMAELLYWLDYGEAPPWKAFVEAVLEFDDGMQIIEETLH